MSFITDSQTTSDLNIFGKQGRDSLYNIFNRTNTRGGARLLEELFRQPLSTPAAINERIAMIRYFRDDNSSFPFKGCRFDDAERYLSATDARSRLSNQGFTMADFKAVQNGVQAVVEIFRQLKKFLSGIKLSLPPEAVTVTNLLASGEMDALWREPDITRLSHGAIVECDNILRFQQRREVDTLMQYIYYLDVCISVAQVALQRNYVFPQAAMGNDRPLKITNVFHPLLKNAVPNSLEMGGERNSVFLTGANMAGKSTFMKSIGIAMYLAHLGFPVAAEEMHFPVMDGIFTTINLPDNLGLGASHFYVEVLRIKKVASLLNTGKKLFVIFDELFRGTNVKDAKEATEEIMEAFYRQQQSLFIISTHIIEAGERLKEKCPYMLFRYLPTVMNNNVPAYTYKLAAGITDDRHGMLIIRNEGVIDLINSNKQAKKTQPCFTVDDQTLEDLNLLGRFKPGSVFGLFNRLQTRGGEKLLEAMFRKPLTDCQQINERARMFSFFQEKQLEFPVSASQFETMENYLSETAAFSLPGAVVAVAIKKMRQSLFHGADLLQLQAGIAITVEALKLLEQFFIKLRHLDQHGLFEASTGAAIALCSHPQLRMLLDAPVREPALWQLAQQDHLLRHKLLPQLRQLLEIGYQLDVFIGVAKVAADRHFVYATALPNKSNTVNISGLYHPALAKATKNNISMSGNSNMIFLTGANMAGKSTLMKSFGIAVYLAHMGFPVAAENMTFSVKDGLYTSINVSDNLNMGYSHFYAEVLRAKTAAAAVNSSLDLYLVFDELFKGTNVKDAYDATYAVTSAFLAHKHCFFMISTHIIEVGHKLREKPDHIQFSYLPTVMKGNIPQYTYQLTSGITEDRQGMLIIKNEKILEML